MKRCSHWRWGLLKVLGRDTISPVLLFSLLRAERSPAPECRNILQQLHSSWNPAVKATVLCYGSPPTSPRGAGDIHLTYTSMSGLPDITPQPILLNVCCSHWMLFISNSRDRPPRRKDTVFLQCTKLSLKPQINSPGAQFLKTPIRLLWDVVWESLYEDLMTAMELYHLKKFENTDICTLPSPPRSMESTQRIPALHQALSSLWEYWL